MPVIVAAVIAFGALMVSAWAVSGHLSYDVDWLLMAAQGYQESQLNQSARSPVGAIGVMQIMPATGAELGRHTLDANVGFVGFDEKNHFIISKTSAASPFQADEMWVTLKNGIRNFQGSTYSSHFIFE